MYDKDEILREIENCPFKPKINCSYNKHALNSVSLRNDIDIYDRNEQWKRNKEMKLMNLKSKYEQDLSEECTFKPKISPSSKISRSRIFDTLDSKSRF